MQWRSAVEEISPQSEANTHFQTSDVEIAAVHDNEWCLTYGAETGRIIDEYAKYFFKQQSLDEKQARTLPRVSLSHY